MQSVTTLAPSVGTKAACEALQLPRASWYRARQGSGTPRPPAPRPCPHRALAQGEREEVLSVLHSDRFVDKAPAQVFATLLDEGSYLCSIRTMYRILEAKAEVRERRDQLRRPNYKKPELLATRPNQVWSWDITKLLGPTTWTYFYLYVILDIFSRYVVGWMVALRESAALAKRLIEETCAKERIQPGLLKIHADRGSSMTSKLVAQLLADLGVTKTHSRPHVSNDNPYSESQFKTLKYRPDFPERFGSLEDARAFCQVFFPWYNTEHRHSGIGLMTPAMVHRGLADEMLRRRNEILARAYAAHPERFVNKLPCAPDVPRAAWINPPRSIEIADPGVLGRPEPRSSILSDPSASPSAEKSPNGLLQPSQLQMAAQ